MTAIDGRTERASILAEQHHDRAQEHREQIIALYKDTGNLKEVMTRLGLNPPLPRSYIAAIVNEIPNREAYRRRGATTQQDPEKLWMDLRKAAILKGQPLTATTYREAARELGLAAYNTIVKYGRQLAPEDPWGAALGAAGVQGNPSRGPREGFYDAEQCVMAVAQCIADHNGERVSYDDYCEWVDGLEGVPSGPTVRYHIPWNSAVEQALVITSRV